MATSWLSTVFCFPLIIVCFPPHQSSKTHVLHRNKEALLLCLFHAHFCSYPMFISLQLSPAHFLFCLATLQRAARTCRVGGGALIQFILLPERARVIGSVMETTDVRERFLLAAERWGRPDRKPAPMLRCLDWFCHWLRVYLSMCYQLLQCLKKDDFFTGETEDKPPPAL